jgi:hypothetical protein
MPTVRVYQPQVQQAALPTPRAIQADTSGYDALARGVGAVASEADRVAKQELEKTRNARLMDAYAELATGRQDIESVAQQQKGKDALGQDLVNQTGELLDNHAAKIAESLSNDQELVDRFKKIQLEQKLQLTGTVGRHVTSENENFQKVSFETALQKASESAKREALLGNVPGAQAELGNLRGVIDSFGAGQGWDKDTKDRVLLSATSATHAGVVKGLLAGDAPRPDLASEYLRTHRAEMTTDAISTAETELKPATLSVKAEQQKTVIVQGATDPKTGSFNQTKALAAAEALPDTDITKPIVRQLVHQAIAAATAADAPREGRLEQGIARFSSLNRDSADYTALSDQGKARVEEKFKAAQRAARVNNSEERRQQAETDRYLASLFDGSLPLKGEAGADQVSINIDQSDIFASGSPTLREILKAKQKKAAAEYAKDLGVSATQFQERASGLALSMGWGSGAGSTGSQFITYMKDKRDRWLAENPGKHAPPDDVVRRMFADEILYGDESGGSMFSRNKYAWQKHLTGEPFVAFGTGDQPANVQAALNQLGSRPAAPAAVPPVAGATHITDGKNHGWLQPGKPMPDGWRAAP